ncbi:MAG: YbdK family carboxylate-amine ligase [Proteobacteria bacterium]|nr:YbdK family carboxylate-amine ligase [Pseudomonadota bacterium]MBU1739358.1 YbdK family carboxylate-amine ligase [Pseudomonadota bacterium]
MVFVPDFIGSRSYTMGVELELQLLDPVTLNLVPAAGRVLDNVPEMMQKRIKPEFIQSMVEVATGVCEDINEVEEDLRESLASLTDLCGQSGCMFFASSLHPFARYQDQLLTPGERYAALMAELQIAGRRMISQGLHVHIGLPDGETAIRVCDAIRPYLPLLLAMTTSSPYFGNVDTGYASYRSRLLDGLSRSGLPYTFRTWDRFRELITDLHRAHLITDVRDIWWDVRPHPDFGTVEIRICDLPVRFTEISAVAALIQALVKTLAETTFLPTFPRLEIINNNKWQAARYGIDGRYVDLERVSVPLTIREAIVDLLAKVRQSSELLGTSARLNGIYEILVHGTGSMKMRTVYDRCKDHHQVIRTLAGDFFN